MSRIRIRRRWNRGSDQQGYHQVVVVVVVVVLVDILSPSLSPTTTTTTPHLMYKPFGHHPSLPHELL